MAAIRCGIVARSGIAALPGGVVADQIGELLLIVIPKAIREIVSRAAQVRYAILVKGGKEIVRRWGWAAGLGICGFGLIE
jgi:hypothetical protein